MRLPEMMPSRPTTHDSKTQATWSGPSQPNREIEPAACCAEVCTPFGCHCVLDLPICP
jgi:hypothetical protein